MNQPIILSFDVEEHFRIEAANHWNCPPDLRDIYAQRMEASTKQILELLAKYNAKATFYVVGQIARNHPTLIQEIMQAGHELASHSWAHQRIHRLTPGEFRQDLLQSKDALEQVSGQPIYGYRAPTFSITRDTAWAIDILADLGFTYDSSIFPVRHDRYGVVDAPRLPFQVKGLEKSILEIPPLTWRKWGNNLPVAGGGYFRLFPLWMMKAGIRQMLKQNDGLAMLYFHPWEFDTTQPRIPLKKLSRFRTYVGIRHSIPRLTQILEKYTFQRAIDVVRNLKPDTLPRFELQR